MDRKFFVYIVTNKHHTVLYTGITNNLSRRMYGHKNKLMNGFTKKYNCEKLVWYEIHNNSYNTIARENKLKVVQEREK